MSTSQGLRLACRLDRELAERLREARRLVPHATRSEVVRRALELGLAQLTSTPVIWARAQFTRPGVPS